MAVQVVLVRKVVMVVLDVQADVPHVLAVVVLAADLDVPMDVSVAQVDVKDVHTVLRPVKVIVLVLVITLVLHNVDRVVLGIVMRNVLIVLICAVGVLVHAMDHVELVTEVVVAQELQTVLQIADLVDLV